MSSYELPSSLNIGGTDYAINADFRSIIGILEACEDPDWTDREKQEIMFEILYKDFEQIPRELREEACKKAADFIDGGMRDKKNSPRLIDWEQDSRIIILRSTKWQEWRFVLPRSFTGGRFWDSLWKSETDFFPRSLRSGRKKSSIKN